MEEENNDIKQEKETTNDKPLLNDLLQRLLNLFIDNRIYHWKTLNKNLELHWYLDEIKWYLSWVIDDIAELIIIEWWTPDIKSIETKCDKETPSEIRVDVVDKLNQIAQFCVEERNTELAKEELVVQQELIDIVKDIKKHIVKLEAITIIK